MSTTEFQVEVGGDSADFASLGLASISLACDLTAAGTLVIGFGFFVKNPPAVGTVIEGQESGKTATVKWINVAGNQALVTGATGFFNNGETLLNGNGDGFVCTDVGNDAIVRINCNAINDTTEMSFYGWTTSATNYIRVYVPPGARHRGFRDTSSKYYLNTNTDGAPCITISSGAEYIRLEGLQISNQYSGGYCLSVSCGTPSDVRISDCIAWVTSGTGFVVTGGVATFMNCLAASSASGFVINNGGDTCFAYNCTAINCSSFGFQTIAAKTLTASNCYAGACGTGFSATGTMNLTACVSSDGSRSTSVVACSTSSGAYFTNITSGAESVILQSASGLRNTGVTLGWVHPDGAVGIAGNKRFFKWDVGCDEYRIPNPTGGRPGEPDAPSQQEN